MTYQKVDGDTYKAQPKKRAKTAKKSTYIPTGKYYIHTDNKKYEIHSHEVTRGKDAGKTCYYIYIVPKSGDGYWKKLNNFSL